MPEIMAVPAPPIATAASRTPRVTPHATLRATLRRWRANRSTRRALARLDADRLADIGLDSATAAAESKLPFWR